MRVNIHTKKHNGPRNKSPATNGIQYSEMPIWSR